MLKINIKNKKLNITKTAIYMATNPHSETLGYFFLSQIFHSDTNCVPVSCIMCVAPLL